MKKAIERVKKCILFYLFNNALNNQNKVFTKVMHDFFINLPVFLYCKKNIAQSKIR